MIKELIIIANTLDTKGLLKEADILDKIISNAMDDWSESFDDEDDLPDWDSEEGREAALKATRAELKEKEAELQEAIGEMNVSAPGEFGFLLTLVKEIEALKEREEEQSREAYSDAYDRMSALEQQEHDWNAAQQDRLDMFRNEY